MKKEHFDFLKSNKACKPGLKWAKTQSDLYDLWNNCHRGDWLLWLAKKLKVDERKQMLCGALCAHTVVHLMTDAKNREAVRIAFLYARGKATNKQLLEVREAAYDAAAAYVSAAAAYASAVAAYDAAAAASAAAAYDASAAAAYDAATYNTAAANAAMQANQLRTAEIARKILTQEVFEKIAELS